MGAPKSPREITTAASGPASTQSSVYAPAASAFSLTSLHVGKQGGGDEGRPNSACDIRRSGKGRGQQEATCGTLARSLWRRPGSAPAGLPWSSVLHAVACLTFFQHRPAQRRF